MSVTRDSNPVVDALHRISKLAGDVEDSGEALGAILDEIVDVFNAATASISLVNYRTRRLEIEASRGLPEHCLDLQLHLGEGVTGWVAFAWRAITC